MDTIKDIWFDANRIYMKTDGGETFSRPLEAFPLLKDASDRERLDFKIGSLVTMFVGNHWMRIFIYPVFSIQRSRIMKMR